MTKQTDYSQYENEELAKLVKMGRDTDGQIVLYLIDRNKPFSIRIWQKYKYSVPIEELRGISYISMTRACKSFSEDRGGLLLTVYAWALERELQQASGNNQSGFHVPRRVQDNVRRYRKAVTEFVSAHQREPTTSEILRMTGFTEDEINELTEAYNAMHPTSLDCPVVTAESDGDCTIGDLLPDQTDLAESVTQSVYVREISDKLDAVMARDLTRPEKIAVQVKMYEADRYAVLGGLSAENVKKCYASGLRKLRQPKSANALRPYLDTENLYIASGLASFKRTGTSSPERITINRLDK